MYEKNLAAAIRAFADSYSSDHDMVLALDAAAEALDPRTMARGDTEVAAPRNCSEIPNGSTPRRSWKRWAYLHMDGEIGGTSESPHRNGEDRPVTVIEGHIDLAEIEREAYRRGEKYGHDNGYAEAMRDMRGSSAPQPIDGVEPMVEQAWKSKDSVFWCGPQPNAWMQEDFVANTPCTVAIWPGVVNGKRVDAGGRDEAR